MATKYSVSNLRDYMESNRLEAHSDPSIECDSYDLAKSELYAYFNKWNGAAAGSDDYIATQIDSFDNNMIMFSISFKDYVVTHTVKITEM
ncbi:hypothetical protein [Vibrio breoganii]|uniref:hypothetical protein n=1 Tax=Vibrio breoganii TaxID=553239 RepID=UPI000C825E9C|nr:hypothetical protein [Vibrio breoganii]PMK30638.1 hypothetical protein BCU03_09480 [Vibrio breoganii]